MSNQILQDRNKKKSIRDLLGGAKFSKIIRFKKINHSRRSWRDLSFKIIIRLREMNLIRPEMSLNGKNNYFKVWKVQTP